MAGFKGLRPPAAGPLSQIPESRWLVTGGCRLPAGDCYLAIPSLLMAQGKQEACRGPWESFRRAPGVLQEGSEMASEGPKEGPPQGIGGLVTVRRTYDSVITQLAKLAFRLRKVSFLIGFR